jgi:hypothetical protein
MSDAVFAPRPSALVQFFSRVNKHPRRTAALLLWGFGLWVALLARAPLKITPEKEEAYRVRVDEVSAPSKRPWLSLHSALIGQRSRVARGAALADSAAALTQLAAAACLKLSSSQRQQIVSIQRLGGFCFLPS